MASIVTVTAALDTVTGEPGGDVEHTFTVSNATGAPIRIGTQVIPGAGADPSWFRIAGGAERDLAEQGADQWTVQVRIPADAKAGKYTFRLLVYSVSRPGEDFTEGPAVAVEVVPTGAPPEPSAPPRRFPWWIVAVGVGIVVVGVITWVVWPKGVTVPDLVGQPLNEAKLAIGEAGLALGTVDRKNTDEQPPGAVWTQDPPAGQRVPKESSVALTLAAKPERPPEPSGTASLREDCIRFNPAQVEVSAQGSRWLLKQIGMAMKLFEDRDEASAALATIRHYGMDKQCFIGRPDPSMEYWLRNDSAPSGSRSGEDCLRFNASSLQLRDEGGRWLMTDGRSRMRVFPNQPEAEKALAVIRKHGFTFTCYIGRPGPSMTYFRK